MSQQQLPGSMNKRLIALGAMGVVAIGLFLLVRLVNLDTKQNAEPTEDPFFGAVNQPDPLFPDAQLDTVSALIIEDHSTGAFFRAKINDEGAWEITEAKADSDTGLGVDEPSLTAALSALPTLRPTSVLSEIEGLIIYGLDNPTYTIWFTITTGSTYTMDIGGTNPSDSSYYATVGGLKTNVYLLLKSSIDPVIDFLENPPYIQPTEEDGTPSPSDT